MEVVLVSSVLFTIITRVAAVIVSVNVTFTGTQTKLCAFSADTEQLGEQPVPVYDNGKRGRGALENGEGVGVVNVPPEDGFSIETEKEIAVYV